MTIIELANDSGLTYYGMGKDRARFIHHLEKFAALVDAAARADEREACAKVCDAMEEKAEGTECCKWPTPIDCAHAIRARGTR